MHLFTACTHSFLVHLTVLDRKRFICVIRVLPCFSREAQQTFSTLTQSSPERWCPTLWAALQIPPPASPPAAPTPSTASHTSLEKTASSEARSLTFRSLRRFWTLEKHWTVMRVKAVTQETQRVLRCCAHFAFIIRYFISMHSCPLCKTEGRCGRRICWLHQWRSSYSCKICKSLDFWSCWSFGDCGSACLTLGNILI